MAKYQTLVNGIKTLIEGLTTSAGAADAGKIIQTDSTGRIDSSLLPVGLGADVKVATAGEALTAGEFVYISSGGTVLKAAATAAGQPCVGFVLSSVANGQSATVYLEGRNTSLTGLTPGARYYLSTTAGGFTTTPQTTAGNKHQFLGTAVSATELDFEKDDYIVV